MRDSISNLAAITRPTSKSSIPSHGGLSRRPAQGVHGHAGVTPAAPAATSAEEGSAGKTSATDATRERGPGRTSRRARLKFSLKNAERNGGVERHAAHVFVDLQGVTDRRERPLLAVAALAEPARDADGRRHVGAIEVDAVGVDHLASVLDPASEA